LLRTCSKCGITDDAPRDVINVAPGAEPVNFHMDCHAALGCKTCLAMVAAADGAQNDELRTYLLSLEPTGPTAPLED